MDLLPPERQLMDALLAGDDPTLAALRRQFAVAALAGREFTGAGIYVNFEVPAEIPAVEPADLLVGDVIFDLPDREAPGEAILWVRGGRIATLEAFTYQGEWPRTGHLDNVRYWSGADRDIDWLRGSWGAQQALPADSGSR